MVLFFSICPRLTERGSNAPFSPFQLWHRMNAEAGRSVHAIGCLDVFLRRGS